jgi:energy-coupling factor transport system substrate-specific component
VRAMTPSTAPSTAPVNAPAQGRLLSAPGERTRAAATYLLVALIGLAAFGWPFITSSRAVPGSEHGGDAWLWAALLGAAVAAALVIEVHRGAMRGAHVAVLGVLSAMIGLLRLVRLAGGGNAMWFVLILAAVAFGPRFGALLGLNAMAASAVITAGIGPWLPFQMLAAATLGALAGWIGVATRAMPRRPRLVVLAAFGWIAAFAFGLVINLWSWPLIQDGGALSYAPGLGLATTLHRYWSFYVADSLAWDAAGALLNAICILTLGGPMLAAFDRVTHRLAPVTVWE